MFGFARSVGFGSYLGGGRLRGVFAGIAVFLSIEIYEQTGIQAAARQSSRSITIVATAVVEIDVNAVAIRCYKETRISFLSLDPPFHHRKPSKTKHN